MRVVMGVGRSLVAGMLVWALVGCGSAVEGAAEPASGQEGLFNPCTDIPDSVIESLGLDPSTEDIDILGVEQPGWKICSWTASWYYLIVYSNEYSIADAKANLDFTGFNDIQVGTRVGLQFHRDGDVDIDRCYVALSVAQGSIWVAADLKGSHQRQGAMCDLSSEYAQKLEIHLPR